MTDLKLNSASISLEELTVSESEKTVDIGSWRHENSYVTIDYGLKNTAVNKSKITFLNREEGVTSYGGYPIEQLADLTATSNLYRR